MSKLTKSGSTHGSVFSYTTGFLFSVLLTVAAYLITVHKILPASSLIWLIAVLGLAQLFVQLVFFLHLERESSPRWNLVAFLFAMVTVIILVAGTLWIMNHLNYHGMSPSEVDATIFEEEAIYH